MREFLKKNIQSKDVVLIKYRQNIDMEIQRERLLIRLNDGNEINDEIKEGGGTMAYTTEIPLNTFVDICLNKNVTNHGNAEIGLKTVKVLDAVYRSMKSEKMEMIY